MAKYINGALTEPAVIVFDGTSYYGLYEFDLEDEMREDPDIEVIEKHSYWSDYMDRRIEDFNNKLYNIKH